MPRLKVFRTAIGFHDAIVAAPSRKAALAAWGANNDLFAKHLAEEVNDPKLSEQALARPGEVIRLTRGSASQQLAALGPSKRKARKPTAAEPEIVLPPRPDPEPLDLAREAVERERRRQSEERESLARRKAALLAEEKELKIDQRARLRELEDRARRMKKSYDAEVQAWNEADR